MYPFLICLAIILAAAVIFGSRSSGLRLLRVGDLAPDFALSDQDGQVRRLSDYRGEILLIAFYPADNTPVCRIEASRMSAAYADIRKAGVTPIGVSVQSAASHQSFCRKAGIPYALLSDCDRAVSLAYGAAGSAKELAARVTYIVDRAGRIAYVDPDVSRHLLSVPGRWIEWVEANRESLSIR